MEIMSLTDMITPLAMFISALSLVVMGIAPMVGAAAITGISGLLEGLFGGIAKKQEQREQMDLWKQMLGERRSIVESIKPRTAYSAIEKDLPMGMDVAKQMIMKTLMGRMGGAGVSQDLMQAFMAGSKPTTPGRMVAEAVDKPSRTK